MEERRRLGAEVKVANGIGFNVSHHYISRLDRQSDEDLEAIRCSLVALQVQVSEALRGISLEFDNRYEADTMDRTGRYAIE